MALVSTLLDWLWIMMLYAIIIIWGGAFLINILVTIILDKEFYLSRLYRRYGFKRLLTNGWKLVLSQPIIAVLGLLDVLNS